LLSSRNIFKYPKIDEPIEIAERKINKYFQKRSIIVFIN